MKQKNIENVSIDISPITYIHMFCMTMIVTLKAVTFYFISIHCSSILSICINMFFFLMNHNKEKSPKQKKIINVFSQEYSGPGVKKKMRR